MRFLIILLVAIGTYEVLADYPIGFKRVLLKDVKECSCIASYQKAMLRLSAPLAFKKFGITPTFMPVPPKDKLKGGFATADVELGNYIDPLRTIDPVYIRYLKGKKSDNYTLILVDFDAQQGPPPNARILAIDVNVPYSNNLIFGGQKAVPLISFVPSLGTGIHRIAGILYEQNGYIDPDQIEFLKMSKSRVIQLGQFAKTYNLKPEPLAGTFYTTELKSCG
ncbi:phosphatidylethanolamine-binding protein 1-like [Pieris rapae]|uniref:phosphatidylethanolamine-binding protein 1-like n=1 Tax=Pieris rapae TaxID=64459 RepID=UPI001E27DB2E|nr:phosphatidylethanolamine-binding protein 1-like [Pieris rapae]